MTAPHQIQTLKFDLDIPLLSKNKAIQNQVIDLFHSQFTSMLNDVFNTYGNDEEIIIESVTLELNPIASDQLKVAIVKQSREQLAAYFEKYKREKKLGNGVSSFQIKTNNINLHPLLYYLFYGVNSWASEDFLTFEKSWKNHLKNKDFIEHLKIVSWKMNAIKRLVYQLDEALLYETIQKIIPSDASLIKVHHDLLMELFNKKLLAKSGAAHSLKQTAWIATFYFLFIKNRISFSKIEYLNHHLTQLASAYDLNIKELTSNLLTIVRQAKRTNSSVIGYGHTIAIIQKINSEHATEMMHQYDTSIEAVEKLLLKPRKSNEDILFIKKWILTPGNKTAMHHLWIDPLLENVLEMVIEILAPAGKKFILLYHRQILIENEAAPIITSKESLKRAIWLFTLDYLTTSFSSAFQAREFVLSHARRLSNRSGVDYAVFMESLLSGVRSLSESDAKYHELLMILKALSVNRLKSGANKNTTPNLANTMNTDKVEEILNEYKTDPVAALKESSFTLDYLINFSYNPDSIIPHENVTFRSWLLNKNNRKTIQRYCIDSYKEPLLIRIIETILPDKKIFIEQSILAISNLFGYCNLFDSHSLNFKKLLYANLIYYLQDNPAGFNKSAFINLQVKSVLERFNINYKSFLIQYRTYLAARRNSQIKQLEYFNILNSLQNNLEKKYRANSVQADSSEANIKILFEYLETGTIKGDANVLKTPGFKKLHEAIENLLVNHHEKWFLFLLGRNKPLQIHQSVFECLSTSLLRNILLFQSNYNKLLLLQKHLSRHITISLNSVDLALVFYLEEGFFPGWISKSVQHTIETKNYSKQASAVLLLHHWSTNAIHNWVHNIPIIHKKEALKIWINNDANHSLFCLYANLDQVYNNMKSFNQRYSFTSFEKSFWKVFFGVIKLNKTVSSFNFMVMFFEQWEQQFKVSFLNNGEIKKVLKSGLYLPLSIFGVPKKTKSIESKVKNDTNNEFIPKEQYNSADEGFLKKEINESMMNITKWYMKNTGLIIVHPFLPQLFKYLDYLDDKNQFKNEQIIWKTVYLLHYMATGQVGNINEADLAMSKILSGMPIENPIPSDVILSENEINYADEVLQVIISRWDKLGKTSNNGLRNTFLQRKGILEEKNEAFQLAVETSGTDILLDYIPWNISVIKLPWVKNIIYVSWR
jgi:hypothetical protein